MEEVLPQSSTRTAWALLKHTYWGLSKKKTPKKNKQKKQPIESTNKIQNTGQELLYRSVSSHKMD